ncbi:hypothetical protein P9VFCI_007 [Rhizobium phage P9VFCI]|uniref:Uncharacterized protein n=1 Tax=Rhizobium phage P9VFCI TaxID=2763531 RepID=A0A7G7WXQ4_9CAUD|nr:hypothetical protein PP937_gp007 [Rhizobium phage P9VFCI]QNH71998.1 hypothetical protein P9VFCI_007 [Rhizobium phage P9VFCI]
MTQITESNEKKFHSFRVFQGESKIHCCTIGAHGTNLFDALFFAQILYKSTLDQFGGADELDFLHYSDWSKK